MTEQDYPAVIWAVTTAAAVMVGLAGELLAPQSGSRGKVLGHTKTLDQRIFSNRPRTQQSTPDTSQHPTEHSKSGPNHHRLGGGHFCIPPEQQHGLYSDLSAENTCRINYRPGFPPVQLT